MSYTFSKWINLFKEGKAFYTTSDLIKITGYKLASVRKILERLDKKGVLARVTREVFINLFNPPSLEQVACLIYPPTYISGESILFETGILEQSPFALTCITLNKTKTVQTKLGMILYQHIKKELYFGFYQNKGAFFSYPEKALCDYVYLKRKHGESVPLEELNFEELNKNKLKRYLKTYPNSVKQVMELLNWR